jgi:hypothetical protein
MIYSKFKFVEVIMVKKTVRVIIILYIAIMLLALGLLINFAIIWNRSARVSDLIMILISSLYHIVFWLVLLVLSHKKRLKKLIIFYCVFWSLFAISKFIGSFGWIPIVGWFIMVFQFPIIGFDVLPSFLARGFIWVDNLQITLSISVVMMILGFIALMKLPKE